MTPPKQLAPLESAEGAYIAEDFDKPDKNGEKYNGPDHGYETSGKIRKHIKDMSGRPKVLEAFDQSVTALKKEAEARKKEGKPTKAMFKWRVGSRELNFDLLNASVIKGYLSNKKDLKRMFDSKKRIETSAWVERAGKGSDIAPIGGSSATRTPSEIIAGVKHVKLCGGPRLQF